MELLIQADKFVISYLPARMLVLLFVGLLLFLISKQWQAHLRKSGLHSFMPGVLFIVSFIFIIGGINLYVYKIVMNKDMIILFNIKQFNHQIKWSEIDRVDYDEDHKITIFMKKLPQNNSDEREPVQIVLKQLDDGSMAKVKILIDHKLKQSKNTTMNTSSTGMCCHFDDCKSLKMQQKKNHIFSYALRK